VFLWRRAKLLVSELRNPWTDCHKICHGWLRGRYDPATRTPKFKSIASVGASRQMGDFYFFVIQIFDRLPTLNCRIDFHAVWFTGRQSRLLHSKTDKTAKVSVFPFLPKNTSKSGTNRHFQAYGARYWKSHTLKSQRQLQTNNQILHSDELAYASWVIQTCVKQIQDGGRPLCKNCLNFY